MALSKDQIEYVSQMLSNAEVQDAPADLLEAADAYAADALRVMGIVLGPEHALVVYISAGLKALHPHIDMHIMLDWMSVSLRVDDPKAVAILEMAHRRAQQAIRTFVIGISEDSP